jgi:regulator of sirC expression with transglutaminase-like and TPR domain
MRRAMAASHYPSTSHAASLSERQKAALVTLLGDEDPAIYRLVRGKILSLGSQAEPLLKPHVLSSDPVVRRRCQELVRFLGRQQVDNQFLLFCLQQGEDLDLEEGLLLLAQTRYPEINPQAYQALLDSFAGDLQSMLGGVNLRSGRDVLACFQTLFFDRLRFAGNEQNYYDPDNSYLNRVLDRRMGNPISLCMLYLLVGRRLHLPLCGIGLPGHFVCRYQSTTEEIFIDAFNRGKQMTKADCVRYLLENENHYQEALLAPVSSRRILLRFCSNLHQIYTHQQQSEEIARMQRYIIALAR